MTAAHRDGRDAAYRIGKWSKTVLPVCPHRAGTLEFAEWMEGFGEATRERLQPDADNFG